jgi:hypothetical protein
MSLLRSFEAADQGKGLRIDHGSTQGLHRPGYGVRITTVQVVRATLGRRQQRSSGRHLEIVESCHLFPSVKLVIRAGDAGGNLPGSELPWEAFGANFTTEALLEDAVHIAARLGAGSAEFVVTQPHMPCFKQEANERFAQPRPMLPRRQNSFSSAEQNNRPVTLRRSVFLLPLQMLDERSPRKGVPYIRPWIRKWTSSSTWTTFTSPGFPENYRTRPSGGQRAHSLTWILCQSSKRHDRLDIPSSSWPRPDRQPP